MAANTNPIGLSDINAELNYANSTSRAFDDAIFRNLSGVQSITVQGSQVGFSDVDGKIAFAGFTYANTSNATFGFSTPTVNLVCTSDMYSPTVDWTYSVVSGNNNVTLIKDGVKTAKLKLSVTDIGTFTSNVAVTATLSYGGHTIGTNTQYVSLSGTIYDPALKISGAFSVNNSGYTAQTATTTIRASANATLPANSTSIQFVSSPSVGTLVSGNTITFTVNANTPGTDNVQTYSLTTNLLYKGQVIASNVQTISVRANFQESNLVFNAVEGTTNNQFANSGNTLSSLVFTADHNIAGANVVWSVTPVSGQTASFSVSANNQSANVYLPATGFGLLSSVSTVKASLQYANGYVLANKTAQITLRAGAYGLSFVPPTPVVIANGYNAQTATTTASASWKAGAFNWFIQQTGGQSANVTQAVGITTGSITFTLATGNATGNLESDYIVNPVITFDGVVVANVSSNTSLFANFLPYTFDVTGPAENNQIADTSTIVKHVAYSVDSGTVTYSIDNSNITLTSNTTDAVLQLSNTASGANSQTGTFTILLKDASGSLVEKRTYPIALRVYNPNISWTGANNVSVIGYANNQSANTTVVFRTATGATGLDLTAVYNSGAAATITKVGSNNSQQSIDVKVQNPIGSYGTTQAFYTVTANVKFYDQSLVYTYPITVAATELDPNFVFTPTNGNVVTFGPTSTSTATVTASHTVPGGNVVWTYSLISGTLDTAPTSNSSTFSFSTTRSGVGNSQVTMAVTATVYNSNGLFVVSNTATVQALAKVQDAKLALSGNLSVATSNYFSTTAATVISASVAPEFTNAVFTFSVSKISGSAAAINVTANSVTLSVNENGAGSNSAVYNIVCSVRGDSPTQIANTSTQVSLSASCPTPTLYLQGPTSVSNSSYNYPVTTTTTLTAQSSPLGSVSWSYALASGNGSGVAISSNTVTSVGTLTFTMNNSTIGTQSATYNVTANYYSPAGDFIASKSTQVVLSAQRLNPNFNLAGDTDSVTGWESTLTSTATARASVGAGVPTSGLVYHWTLTKASGSTATTSSNSTTGVASISISNSRSTDGTDQATSTYTASCYVTLNGQQIGGPLSTTLQSIITPYYINISPSPSNNVVTSDSPSVITMNMSTNSPAFNGSNITWNISKTAGNGTDSFSGAGTSQLKMTLYPPPYVGNLYSYYTISASLSANGATRTSSGVNTFQRAYSTTSSGGSDPACVTADSWMDDIFQASDVMIGMVFMTWKPEEGFQRTRVAAVGDAVSQPCVRLKTKTGAELVCSESTPFNLRSATKDLDPEHTLIASDMLGKEVMVKDTYTGTTSWDEVVELEHVGERMVVPISFDGASFAAGVTKQYLIFSHNLIKAN